MHIVLNFLLAALLISGNIYAKCTNAVHEKAQAGVPTSKVYDCNVRTSDASSFTTTKDGRMCKKCGCSKNDHNED